MFWKNFGEIGKAIVPGLRPVGAMGIEQKIQPQPVDQCLDAPRHHVGIEVAIGAILDDLGAQLGNLVEPFIVVLVMAF